jgi:hypothetical protein
MLMMAPETYVGGIRMGRHVAARMESWREQPDHGIGIDLQDARTRTATGSLPSA